MNQFKDMIHDMINEINEVTDLFYQQKNNQALSKFNSCLTMLDSFAGIIYDVEVITEEDKNSFLRILTEAMNAMESKDSILLSDVLRYDLIECLEGLLK